MPKSQQAPLAAVWPAVQAVAVTLVPEARALDDAGWDEVRGVMEDALRSRPRGIARGLRAFVRVLQAAALLFHGRGLASLDGARRSRLFERLQRSRLTLVRRGFWGLRTLVLMGFYGRPAAALAIGYRADPRGWQAAS
jgi:hypothetical protein